MYRKIELNTVTPPNGFKIKRPPAKHSFEIEWIDIG